MDGCLVTTGSSAALCWLRRPAVFLVAHPHSWPLLPKVVAPPAAVVGAVVAVLSKLSGSEPSACVFSCARNSQGRRKALSQHLHLKGRICWWRLWCSCSGVGEAKEVKVGIVTKGKRRGEKTGKHVLVAHGAPAFMQSQAFALLSCIAVSVSATLSRPLHRFPRMFLESAYPKIAGAHKLCTALGAHVRPNALVHTLVDTKVGTTGEGGCTPWVLAGERPLLSSVSCLLMSPQIPPLEAIKHTR